MDDGDFRAAAKEDFSRLLTQWTRIELWLKRAEQINGEAIIPAINELRYASRQLFNALRLFDKDPLAANDIKKIERRITIAEQYLLNSEHDIYDSIVTFYRAVINDIEERFGRNIITSHFDQYPAFRTHVSECEWLISDSRGDYEHRADNYNKIRVDHVPQLLALHESLLDAQVSAAEETERTNRAIIFAEGRASLSFLINVLTIPIAIAGIVLALYMWKVTPEQYCVLHKHTPVMNVICE